MHAPFGSTASPTLSYSLRREGSPRVAEDDRPPLHREATQRRRGQKRRVEHSRGRSWLRCQLFAVSRPCLR